MIAGRELGAGRIGVGFPLLTDVSGLQLLLPRIKAPLQGAFIGRLQLCYIECLGAFRSLFSIKAY